MCSQSENSKNKPKIRFIDNLWIVCDAICLYWINEIHIDSSYKDSPLLKDIIKHEMKHYKLLREATKALREKRILKAFVLIMYNDIFDIIDGLKIVLKKVILYCKSKLK